MFSSSKDPCQQQPQQQQQPTKASGMIQESTDAVSTCSNENNLVVRATQSHTMTSAEELHIRDTTGIVLWEPIQDSGEESTPASSIPSMDLEPQQRPPHMMAVSPERRRDETPPTARASDDVLLSDVAQLGYRTESPTTIDGYGGGISSSSSSSHSAVFHHTPNTYLHDGDHRRPRETTPKRRLPANHLHAGKVPPPTRHFDLTPVTRNTSNTDAYMDEYSDDDNDYCVITPEDTTSDLHGEHLALPSDLSPEISYNIMPGISAVPKPKQLPERRSSQAPSLPPLRSNLKQRTKSVGTLDSAIQTACYRMLDDVDGIENNDPTGEMILQHPVEFPDRQVFSFTSRAQYEQQQRKQLTPEMMVSSKSAASTRGLTPYQPDREDLQDVGALPEEELDRIFTTRKIENTGELVPTSEELNNSQSASLYAPIPLEERQWSIPSIRLAHHLNESTTSNTEFTDEEDDLDEESLTSRGSSLYLPDDAALMGDMSGLRIGIPQRVPDSFLPVITVQHGIIENGQFFEHDHPHIPEDIDESHDAVVLGSNRRRKKRSKKDQRAFEWLHSVEASDDVFAEAASSKFLMRASLPFRSATTTSAAVGGGLLDHLPVGPTLVGKPIPCDAVVAPAAATTSTTLDVSNPNSATTEMVTTTTGALPART